MLNWKNAITFLAICLFLIWIFFGGGNYEYVGIKPLLQYENLPNNIPLYINDSVNTKTTYNPETSNPSINRNTVFQSNTCTKTNNFVSKGERLCREYIENFYNKQFPNIRPNFLRNPETGQNLELDCYNEELGLAIEYSGQQHYVYPNGLHRTYSEFIKQLRRDKFKVQCCETNGVYLIRVPYTVRWNEIPKYIYDRLPENRKFNDGL